MSAPHIPPTKAELEQLRGILGLSLLSVLSKEDCYRLIDEIVRLRAMCGRARTCMVEHEVDADMTTDELMDELRAASEARTKPPCPTCKGTRMVTETRCTPYGTVQDRTIDCPDCAGGPKGEPNAPPPPTT